MDVPAGVQNNAHRDNTDINQNELFDSGNTSEIADGSNRNGET